MLKKATVILNNQADQIPPLKELKV